MKMIKILLLFVSFIFYGQILSCDICIVDSNCEDDYIHFNISISNDCEYPMETYFSYDTDVESEKHYVNKTVDCRDCHIDLTIDPVHDAWDYTLTLVSPESTKTCSDMRIAHCGGTASKLVWIITGGLSGLFVLLGATLCTIRYCRTQRQQTKTKTISAAVINT
jgi:hypothetical protein